MASNMPSQGGSLMLPSKRFIQLIDEFGIRFSILRDSAIYYHDEGELRILRYQDWSKTANGPHVVEMKVKTTYEDLVRELG